MSLCPSTGGDSWLNLGASIHSWCDLMQSDILCPITILVQSLVHSIARCPSGLHSWRNHSFFANLDHILGATFVRSVNLCHCGFNLGTSFGALFHSCPSGGLVQWQFSSRSAAVVEGTSYILYD